jgi:hypothetical protein
MNTSKTETNIIGRPLTLIQDISALLPGQRIEFNWTYTVCVYTEDFESNEDVILEVASPIKRGEKTQQIIGCKPADDNVYVVEFLVKKSSKSNLKNVDKINVVFYNGIDEKIKENVNLCYYNLKQSSWHDSYVVSKCVLIN